MYMYKEVIAKKISTVLFCFEMKFIYEVDRRVDGTTQKENQYCLSLAFECQMIIIILFREGNNQPSQI